MPLNPINVGTAPNNSTGEALRLGGQKINANFTFLKTYIDNLLQGLKWKQRVLVGTTVNISLSGEQTIDGVVTNASRVLVKNQTDKTENGIYISGVGAWVRSEDADTGDKLVSATVSVVSGTVNANTNWTSNAESITLGTTDVTFVNFSNIASGVSFEQLQIEVQDLEDELRAGYTGSLQSLYDLIQSGTYDDTQIRADFAAADDDLALQIDAVEEDLLLLEANKANDSEVVKQVNKSDGTPLPKVNGVVTLLPIEAGVNFTTDESLYLDTTTDILRANVSTYAQTLTKAGSQIFTLDFEPTNFVVVHGRVTLFESDYIFTSPTTLEIIPELAEGEKVRVVYERFVTQPA